MITTKTKLSHYAESTYAVFRDLAEDSVYQLKRSAVIYETWAAEQPDDVRHVQTITDESLSRCLLELRESYSQAYLRKMRGDWLTLLRAAADDGLRAAPKKVRPIAKPKPKPRAWTHAQVEAIVCSAFGYRGRSEHGIELASYFGGITLVGWDTGLRKGDLEEIQQTMIDDVGRVRITQHKTGDEHFCRISAAALAVTRSIMRKHPYKWPGADCQFYYHWHRIVERAGVPLLGGMHALRRSGSTDVARIAPGLETRFLGHTSAQADARYVDKGLAGGSAPMPTPLKVPPTSTGQAG